ncbi:MAG: allophanate hydrolase [Fluviicola sp.]|nr:MAG: allophanate hydrolase [Fluviicola sp.]
MIEVIKQGLRSSLQDEGRFGYRDQGVPLSGAMDHYAFHLGNHLLGNEKGTVVIEMMLQGPELYFTKSTYIAITGAPFEARLNGKAIPHLSRVFVPAGSNLKFKPPKYGVFGYIAVQGGIKMKPILNSLSYYPKVADDFLLSKGQKLEIKQHSKKGGSNAKVGSQLENSDKTIDVYPGPEFHLLSRENQKDLTVANFKIGLNSSRMGYEIKHTMQLQAKEIITSPVQPGTVQLTPSGNLICLMRDAQTTGGYARVFQLSENAINKISQKRNGEEIKFKICE